MDGLYGTYYLNIQNQNEPGQQVSVCLRAISEEGYMFEYELFSGITAEEGFEESESYLSGEYRVFDAKGGKYVPAS